MSSSTGAGATSSNSTSSSAVSRSPFANKGLQFTREERVRHGLEGLLPSAIRTPAQQVALVMEGLDRLGSNTLAKYELLISLLDQDAELFFTAMLSHTSKLMPLVYTPVVGEACINWSHLLAPTRGLYITLEHAGRVADILRSWPSARPVKAICITDGERILGLGDLGANGMGIPVGKLALYSGLAGVDPRSTLPITLDVGTNNAAFLADPLYVGLRRKREAPGPTYDALVHEFVEGVKTVFGPRTLIQWEDFGNTNAFRVLQKYKNDVPSFNDDIEGTASVVLGGLLSATMHVPGIPPLGEGRYLFYGAGEAGVGIADLLAYTIALQNGGGESIPSPSAVDAQRARIFLVDSKGLVTSDRIAAEGAAFAHHKVPYAHTSAASLLSAASAGTTSLPVDLEGIVRLLKPTALIGVSAQPATFTQGVVEAMAAQNARPLIFSLSNPTSKSECTAAQAYEWTNGTAVFASGSPFDPLTLKDGTVRVPGQGNNAYIFPALGLACIAVQMASIPEHSMYIAAAALAAQVKKEDVATTGCIYPPLSSIRTVSAAIATAVANNAYDLGIAELKPRPADMEKHIKENMWTPSSFA